MAYKIAAASSDGKVVNSHFGKAEQFVIIEVSDEGNSEIVELRRLEPVCDGGDHDDQAMSDRIRLLSDCRYVIVSRIGPRAENELEAAGIAVYVIPDLLESAIGKLISYVEINRMIYG